MPVSGEYALGGVPRVSRWSRVWHSDSRRPHPSPHLRHKLSPSSVEMRWPVGVSLSARRWWAETLLKWSLGEWSVSRLLPARTPPATRYFLASASADHRRHCPRRYPIHRRRRYRQDLDRQWSRAGVRHVSMLGMRLGSGRTGVAMWESAAAPRRLGIPATKKISAWRGERGHGDRWWTYSTVSLCAHGDGGRRMVMSMQMKQQRRTGDRERSADVRVLRLASEERKKQRGRTKTMRKKRRRRRMGLRK